VSGGTALRLDNTICVYGVAATVEVNHPNGEPVDPIALGVVVAALVSKLAARAEDGAVDATFRAIANLASWLRERLPGGPQSALVRVEEAPDSPKRLQALADEIEARVAIDPEFRNELQVMVEAVQAAGVNLVSVSQQVWGNSNVIIANASASDIRVSYEGRSAT